MSDKPQFRWVAIGTHTSRGFGTIRVENPPCPTREEAERRAVEDFGAGRYTLKRERA